MRIERKRYVVMRKNRTEVWCGLAKHFSFRPISEIRDVSVKTYRSEAQARSGCSSWDKDFEVVPVIETIATEEALTLEELREMDGEPVYSGKYKRWFLVIYFNALNKSQLMDRTGTPYITEDCAPLYRRPPEGEEEP